MLVVDKRPHVGGNSYDRHDESGLLIHPYVPHIFHTNSADVFAYLKNQKIPLPPSSGRAATGVDLSTPSILWLHDTYPADYEKLRAHFPYVQAVVERRRFYGDVRV